MNAKAYGIFFAATIIFSSTVQAAQSSFEPIAPTPNADDFSMEGTWVDPNYSDCKFYFDNDDGSTVHGICDTGVKHYFSGKYTKNKREIILKITRVGIIKQGNREFDCEMKVKGTIKILNSNTVEFEQDPWPSKCGVISDGKKGRPATWNRKL